MLKLPFGSIQDLPTRDIIQKITDFLNANVLMDGTFRFAEIEFLGAVTDYKFKHNMKFVPKDIVLVSKDTENWVIFSLNELDTENIYITATGPAKVRFYMGSYGPINTPIQVRADGTNPDLPGRLGDCNIDGGRPDEVYLPCQHIDGGTP